jgi:hypothetical protein
MMRVISNKCISEKVTDTRMKQFENSMNLREVLLETLDICFISYSANFSAIFKFFPRTPQLCLIDSGYGL